MTTTQGAGELVREAVEILRHVMISRLDVERLHESLRRWLEGEQ